MSVTITEAATPVAVRSGIAWGPIFGGAVVATAVTVMLAALGSGLGLAWVSPTARGNPSPVTFTVLAAIWLIIVQWIASFFGGYLAGRLRPALGGIHRDEVTFRDTAAGFVTWAVSSLLILGLVTSGLGSAIGSLGKAATSVVSSAAAGAGNGAAGAGYPSGYVLDRLFRPSQNTAQTSNPQAEAEAGRILATAATGPIDRQDHDYLVQLVGAQTGLSAADASARVDQTISSEQQALQKAKQLANAARKAAASFALYTFFSMLVGAFIASVAGAIGGRQRDSF